MEEGLDDHQRWYTAFISQQITSEGFSLSVKYGDDVLHYKVLTDQEGIAILRGFSSGMTASGCNTAARCLSVEKAMEDSVRRSLPKQSDFAAVKALQMTTSSDHPIHCFGLEKVIKQLQPSGPLKLYTVVPDDRFEAFQKQEYVTMKDEPTQQVLIPVQDAQQYGPVTLVQDV